jgi:FAD/FMN-containing dehydrogenase
VYNFLEPHGLVVVGGRGEDVGVGGLVLGGGVSHFTPKHGLACDNVKGFQVRLRTMDASVLSYTEPIRLVLITTIHRS